MRPKEFRVIITFENTTTAMAMEKFCKEHGLKGRLIPVPRVITAGCGLAWSASHNEREELEDRMKEFQIGYDQIYELEI